MKQFKLAMLVGTFVLNFVAIAAFAGEVPSQPAPPDSVQANLAAPAVAAPADDPSLKICQCSKDNCGPLPANAGDQRSQGNSGNHSTR